MFVFRSNTPSRRTRVHAHLKLVSQLTQPRKKAVGSAPKPWQGWLRWSEGPDYGGRDSHSAIKRWVASSAPEAQAMRTSGRDELLGDPSTFGELLSFESPSGEAEPPFLPYP